ncbi:MAG: helicase, partial [Candidatus Jacksonbacteria bacterium]|nr:helicase [Candidatus Jacksonbacteria bacterium]
MSTDLTFLTNEPNQTLLERFNALLKEDTRFFDCLVGYFFLSGFHKLHPSLEKAEKIRILIGIGTDTKTSDLIQQGARELDFKSHAETKEEIPGQILQELEQADDFHVRASDAQAKEDGVRKFVDWIRSGKLEIKAYPTNKIHAKLYVMTFHEGDRDKGRVITGSSNFSQSGLQDNLEFNVELKNRADYEFALNNFNRLWETAVDVSDDYVVTIQEKSPFANFTPYELYLKFLYEYFKGELSPSGEVERAYVPINFKKLKYQDDAVMTAKKTLDEYGGVFISDVVGLGKTYISALLAQQLTGRTLVLAPPGLLDRDNPGSWTNVFDDFRVACTPCSIGKLDDLLERGVEKFDNVFIDEAHRFRTEATPTYEKLYKICRGKKVILVSATPLNNAPKDILSQIKLFQPAKNSTIPNVRDLEHFFGELEKKLKKLDRTDEHEEYVETVRGNSKAIRERVLKYLMIRRTRTEIQKYYGDDLSEQDIRFPEVNDPEPLFYAFNEEENEVFTSTLEQLAQRFTYARYQPLTYYEGESRESDKQGQLNLAKFMKILLVKRLESSFFAFRSTIERFVQSYERYIQEFKNGHVYISKKHIHKVFDWLDDDNTEAVERLIEEDKAEKLSADDFSPRFINDLQNDLSILREIHAMWLSFKRDPKWIAFMDLLKSREHLRSNKIVVFTESKETAAYLTKRFKTDLNENVVLFSGESSEETRRTIIANFDANATHQKDDFRVLVTTEVLSEGVNLHRANTVINYDIPWNPTRLMQRVGRVNRINTKFPAIYTFNFFPTKASNDVIKLKEAAEAKIHGFIEMLGSDARLLTDGEEIKSHDLFQRLNSRKTITGEDEQEETELE